MSSYTASRYYGSRERMVKGDAAYERGVDAEAEALSPAALRAAQDLQQQGLNQARHGGHGASGENRNQMAVRRATARLQTVRESATAVLAARARLRLPVLAVTVPAAQEALDRAGALAPYKNGKSEQALIDGLIACGELTWPR